MNVNIETLVLSKGAHRDPDEGMCVMELSAYLAHEPFSDHPACVSPVLGAFLREWNDSLGDEDRQMLKPYAERVLGTAGDPEAETRRSWMAADWIIRTYTPAWLELAGLTEHASALRSFPEIKSESGLPLPEIENARGAASAASAAARDAAWDAAWDAARAAAWDAAWDSAGDAAWDAAGDAAWDAARAALATTVSVLRESAFDLIHRMIDVKGGVE